MVGISNLLSYDVVLSLAVGLFVLLFSIVWFTLKSGSNIDNENNEHDEELFKQPPPQEEDCPICFLRMPSLNSGSKYQTCCGKVICCGCAYAPLYDSQSNKVDNQKCPFCRTLWSDSDEEDDLRYKIRMEANDAIAIHNVGVYYSDGLDKYPLDHAKALELWHRAAELGYAEAYTSIGYAYKNGEGVEVDEKKAVHYYERAAVKGSTIARQNLGNNERRTGNMENALKHYMIAVRSGDANSLTEIYLLYSNGHATKDDYTKALSLYQKYLGEIKSDLRDEAAEADEEEYRYY